MGMKASRQSTSLDFELLRRHSPRNVHGVSPQRFNCREKTNPEHKGLHHTISGPGLNNKETTDTIAHLCLLPSCRSD